VTIIYDVGMHNGDDTAYYLQKGCKVVAIEADPALCEQARRRFADRLGDGLEILNIGIAKAPGELDFFVHRRSSVLSTFRPPKDAGNAEIWRRISVPTARLSDIVRAHGEPRFIKIDIEHFDVYALEDLRAAGITPPAISAEAHEFEVLVVLLRMGYARFKFVNCAQVSRRFRSHKIRLGDGTLAEYSFPHHSSGPFGADLPGTWLSPSQATYLYHGRHVMLGAGWFDVHAEM
jgi:FkbM family methyltransferase